ncbi:hypothetical protein DM02DRAFT_620845 [Periconia macrospinosa]|uniref:Uncharacterized protein n=1 Tax=Periconia macrospinosa TaxID=97972 RepID=A0A2V1CYS1_9PLEO|nr:hypothetical protein DM02DRAFT_620845 [Periconia macrospinosa]
MEAQVGREDNKRGSRSLTQPFEVWITGNRECRPNLWAVPIGSATNNSSAKWVFVYRSSWLLWDFKDWESCKKEIDARLRQVKEFPVLNEVQVPWDKSVMLFGTDITSRQTPRIPENWRGGVAVDTCGVQFGIECPDCKLRYFEKFRDNQMRSIVPLIKNLFEHYTSSHTPEIPTDPRRYCNSECAHVSRMYEHLVQMHVRDFCREFGISLKVDILVDGSVVDSCRVPGNYLNLAYTARRFVEEKNPYYMNRGRLSKFGSFTTQIEAYIQNNQGDEETLKFVIFGEDAMGSKIGGWQYLLSTYPPFELYVVVKETQHYHHLDTKLYRPHHDDYIVGHYNSTLLLEAVDRYLSRATLLLSSDEQRHYYNFVETLAHLARHKDHQAAHRPHGDR